MMGKRGEGHLGGLPRQLCYSLLFRGDRRRTRRSHGLSLQRFRVPAAHPCFLRKQGRLGTLAPAGPSGWFPAFTATMSCSESLSFVPPPFVSFAWRYHPMLGCSYLLKVSAPHLRAGVLWITASPTAGPIVETTGPPRFLGDPPVHMPCSPTPAESLSQAISALRCSLPQMKQRRLPRGMFRGSITRPIHSRPTLRSPGHPGATQG